VLDVDAGTVSPFGYFLLPGDFIGDCWVEIVVFLDSDGRDVIRQKKSKGMYTSTASVVPEKSLFAFRAYEVVELLTRRYTSTRPAKSPVLDTDSFVHVIHRYALGHWASPTIVFQMSLPLELEEIVKPTFLHTNSIDRRFDDVGRTGVFGKSPQSCQAILVDIEMQILKPCFCCERS
jgi:hypothetical protein